MKKKKGNKILFILMVIAGGLLPFSLFNVSSLFIDKGEDKTINISGSISPSINKYNINLYQPDGLGGYKLMNNFEVLKDSKTTISNLLKDNNISFNPINNYIFNNNIYSNLDLANSSLINLNLEISQDLNLYPGYEGYFVQGFFDKNWNKREGKQIQLEYIPNTSNDNYDFVKLLDLGISGDTYASQVFKVQYKSNIETLVGKYESLHTKSGKYQVSFNSKTSNNNCNYSRYIEIKIPSNSWLSDGAKVGICSFEMDNTWIDGLTKEMPSGSTLTFGKSLGDLKYSFLIPPHQKYIYLVRINPNTNKIWNLSQKLDLTGNQNETYTYQKYFYVPDKNTDWDWFNLI